jgi:V/A-type H+-transporting ATPase subunit C
MAKNSYPFASIVIKSKEIRLLKNEDIAKLLASESAQEAAELLMEWGYGGMEIESPAGYEKLISREMDETYRLIRKISPEPQITDLFFLRHDYHNLKVILKSMQTGMGANERNLMRGGTYEISALLSAVQDKKYGALTDKMREALTEIDRVLSVNQDISLIDVTLDRAWAEEVAARIKDQDKRSFVKRYFGMFFDMENILTLLRSRDAGLSRDLFLRALLPEGNLSRSALDKAYDLPGEEMKSVFARGRHAGGIAAGLDEYLANGSMKLLEKYRDDVLLRTAGEDKNNLFSIAPIVYYLIQKEREAKAVRMVMTAKLNDIEKDWMSKILVEV